MTLRPPIEVLLGSALAVYTATSLWWSNADLVYSSVYLVSLAIAGIAGYRLEAFREVWLGCCIAVTLNLASTPVLVYGLFGNPNVFGCAIALCLAAALAYHFYWFLPIAGFGLWYCSSRTALLGAGVACLLGLWRRFPATAVCAVILVVPTILWIKDDIGASLYSRAGIWEDTINHLTFFGRGWGAFFNDYAAFYKHTNMTLTLANHAYNDLLELIFELGIFAVLAFWLFVLALEADHEHRTILLTYAALSLTFFPLYTPFVGHLVVFTLASALRQTRSYSYGPLAPCCPALS